ncbi:MAG: sporulation protein YqfD, partial [Clostridia bacterium]|nr:sporulation protein YqfD [Clostridia bacterium]
ENKEDKKLVNAVGQVYGIAEKEEVFNVPKMQIISTRTGNTVKRNTLSLFGLSIKRKVPFDNFEEVYKNSNLTKGYFLPLSIKSSTFFEINREIVETDLVKAQEYLQSLTKLQEEQSGGCVISQEISVLEMPDFYEITVKTKTERNFC